MVQAPTELREGTSSVFFDAHPTADSPSKVQKKVERNEERGKEKKKEKKRKEKKRKEKSKGHSKIPKENSRLDAQVVQQ